MKAGQAVPREVMQVGVHGVGMDLEQSGDRGGGSVCGVEQEHLGATPLPGEQRFLQSAVDSAEFRRGRLPYG